MIPPSMATGVVKKKKAIISRKFTSKKRTAYSKRLIWRDSHWMSSGFGAVDTLHSFTCWEEGGRGRKRRKGRKEERREGRKEGREEGQGRKEEGGKERREGR